MATSESTSFTAPEWWRSPPTPETPDHVDAIPEEDRREVVECGGRLYDRITLHRWHDYTPPAVLDKAGPILSMYLRREWTSYYGWRGAGIDTDAQPENREDRARLVALATDASAGRHSPAVERRRAWLIIDWRIHVEAAALLELAGWPEYATAFRALPPIRGARALPRGAATLFRKAHRDTDKASTLALSGIRPYRRKMDRDGRPLVEKIGTERTRRLDKGGNLGHRLEKAAFDAHPGMRQYVKDDDVRPSERTDLGRALQAGAFARMCIDYDPRISDKAVQRTLDAVAASGRELLRELIAMGRG